MQVKVFEDPKDKKIWNDAARHPLVTWEWGEARKKMGIEVLRLGETHGNKLKSAFQVTFHPIPNTRFTVGYMPRTRIPSEGVMEALRKEGKKRRCVFMKMEPYVRRSDLENLTLKKQYHTLKKNTNKSSHPLFPKWTQIIDLNHKEDVLLKRMKPKWRYNIRLAQRKGVKVKEMTNDEGFEIFCDLYFKTVKRQKYYGHNRKYHEIVFEALRDDISQILVASYKGEPLAAYHLFLFKGTLYYPYGGSSLQHRNLMASNLIMWEAICHGRNKRAMAFDLWGSLPPDYKESGKKVKGAKERWQGFTHFKEGFNTEYIEFIGTFDLVLNPILYRVYNVADVIRKRFIL